MLSISLVNAQTSSWDIVQEMGRGINLGNTLTAPIEGNWAPVVYEQYFIDVANEGFSNVRIPIDFFGDREKFKTWLLIPNYALGNAKPIDLLKDSYGKEMVVAELTRVAHGIFI